MGYRAARAKKVWPYRRNTAEQSVADLKAKLKREQGLRHEETAALLKILHGELLNQEEKRQAAQGARQLIRQERHSAREVLATFRGDRVLRDERVIDSAADDALRALGFEGLVPELADSGAEYITTDRGVVHPRLVNADDMTADMRRVLGVLVPA